MTYEFADGYKIRDQEGLHFLTFTVVGWIDLFTRQIYRDEFLKNLAHCATHKGLNVGAYVIMSNHAHLICSSEAGRLSDTIRDLKSYCTKQFINIIQSEPESRKDWLLHMFRYHGRGTGRNDEFKIWTNDNHPEEIVTENFLKIKLNYIHENPVRAGWVKAPEDWLYSSASNYATGAGIFPVTLLL